MNDQQLKQLKNQLSQDLQDVKSHLHEAEHLETTELSYYDNHPADNATDLTNQHTEMAIEGHKEKEIEQIENLLQAIENGTYGNCSVCKDDIPFERLKALPTAKTCIVHANQNADSESRPSEEAVLGSSTKHPVKNVDGVRDIEDSFEDVENFGSSDTPQDVDKDNQQDFYRS